MVSLRPAPLYPYPLSRSIRPARPIPSLLLLGRHGRTGRNALFELAASSKVPTG